MFARFVILVSVLAAICAIYSNTPVGFPLAFMFFVQAADAYVMGD